MKISLVIANFVLIVIYNCVHCAHCVHFVHYVHDIVSFLRAVRFGRLLSVAHALSYPLGSPSFIAVTCKPIPYPSFSLAVQ
jgi:hypothetical protein